MSSVLTSDIFFFITSIAVILLTVLAAIAIGLLIKTLQRVRDVADKVAEVTDEVATDLRSVRQTVKNNKLLSKLGAFFVASMTNKFKDIVEEKKTARKSRAKKSVNK